MRLLFANFHRGWGGQSAAVVILAREMARRGHEVLVAGVRRSELVRRATAAGLRTYGGLELLRGFRPGPTLHDHCRLSHILRGFDPHGILSNGSQDTWACALARWRLGHPAFFVRWRHNTFPVAAHRFNRWLYRSLIDRVAVSSITIAPLLTENGLVRPEEITVFSPSTDLGPFLNARRQSTTDSGIRRQMNAGPDGPLAVSVGRLAPEKGHDTLIRAWRRVVDELPCAKLAIAGTGRMEAALRALISDLCLQDHVSLLGFRDDVPALYAEADVAVLAPVAGESFGIALLEAYASGLPCVATDVGGVKEMVLDGTTGFLVRPGDVEAIGEAFLKLLRDRKLRERMGREGKAHVLSRFTPEKLGDTAEALFLRLVGPRTRPQGARS